MKAPPQKLASTLLIIALALAAGTVLMAAASAQTSENIQNEFLALVNAERASLGKPPFAANTQLQTAAYLHSKDMGDNDYFSHTSLDGTQFSQRITAAGYDYVAAAENIAMAFGAPDAAKVYDMWRNSPGHYANMIGNYLDAGLGVYSTGGYTYYTLDLGRSQTASPTQTPRPTASPTPTPQPTAPSTTTATTTPTPTSSHPTPSTTQDPTSTNTASATPTATSVIPELSSLALLSAIFLVLAIAVTVKLKKGR
jgi:uncharacterized protein YkwD